MPTFKRTCGIVAVAASMLVVGCGDPDFETDLNSAGPPQILSIAILSESAGDELATFCTGDADAKAPEALCPSAGTVGDAVPMGWYARVIFDELLDADKVEELIEVDGVMSGHINTTLPVELSCGGNSVAYDGFYDPSGNAVTFPPGPAVVVEPTEFVATLTGCELTVKGSVTVDKDNNAAVADLGPHAFAIAAMSLAGTDPEDEAEGVDPTLPVVLQFNAPVDAASITGNITLVDAVSAPVAATLSVDADDASLVFVTPDAALAENAAYTVTLDSPTGTPVADIAGGVLTLAAPISFGFTTGTTPPPSTGN